MKAFRFIGFLRAAIAASAILLVCGGWGFLAHKTIHQLSVYELPAEMQPFFYKHLQYLTDSAVRPDLRRSYDTTENPKHFIDLEKYNEAAGAMPVNWSDAVARYSKDTLLKYGYVPYYVIMEKDRLTKAFATGNEDSIIFYAADLGHYIEDANVPLHTTVNYDGQLTGQRGIHALWESVTPEMEIKTYNLYSSHTAAYLNNPAEAIWEAVRRANSLLPEIFAKEKEVSKQFPDTVKYKLVQKYGKTLKYYTDTFAIAYGQALKPTINEQLINSANLVADFWYTAWVDAGKPDFTKIMHQRFRKKDAKRLQKQLNSFKNNTLIKDGLLNSTKGSFRE
ncbi:MAG TPA: zinc dependent phospholipase C family protein [Chitinophagaceae bacterium]|nr:zinc dependent phospholipase C family protein [Chitinophagaceae bacterium]